MWPASCFVTRIQTAHLNDFALLELMWISHMWQVWDGVESGRCLRAYTCHMGAVRDASWTSCGRRLLSGSFDNTAAITDVETGEQQNFRLIRNNATAVTLKIPLNLTNLNSIYADFCIF